MRMHLRYLRYVLLHKLFVFAAGVAMRGFDVPFLWRLLVHDRSKFRPSEWRAYAEMFYGEPAADWIERKHREIDESQRRIASLGDRTQPTGARQLAEAAWGREKARRKVAFDRAWLLHQHRNPHHWQHWLLQQDDGRRLVVLPPADTIDEMVCDWIGAGTKILEWPSLAECIAKTVVWYMNQREIIQLRDLSRRRVEQRLVELSAQFGMMDMAYQVQADRAARASIVVPGRA